MSDPTIVCDHAIFTSVRSPTGEGYRIIAASKGLRPEERQAITRYSPSHEGLCPALSDPEQSSAPTPGVCFYELPTARLCVSISTTAGAEHTGRGGQRVYTVAAVFHAREFPRLAYNPFAVARAMIAAGLAAPQLKPPTVLPELTLAVADAMPPRNLRFASAVTSACRRHVLSGILANRSVVLDIPEAWLESAELLLLGVPGPLRVKTSLAAGLKFSAGRCQRLNVTHDDNNVARNRAAGQPIEFVDPHNASAPDAAGAWIALVDRHWEKGESALLARRTNRAFADASPPARERLARLYALIDDVVSIDAPRLISTAGESLAQLRENRDAEVLNDFLSAVGRELHNRFRRQPWTQSKPLWPALLAIAKRDPAARAFAAPLLHAILRAASANDALDACETAAEWERTLRTDAAPDAADLAVIDDLYSRSAAWLDVARDLDPRQLRRLVNKLAAIRPHCPIVDRMFRRCATLEAAAETGAIR